jgi:hypothetical protein
MFTANAKPEQSPHQAVAQATQRAKVPNLLRKVLDVLRTADKPLTAIDIAKAALERQCCR